MKHWHYSLLYILVFFSSCTFQEVESTATNSNPAKKKLAKEILSEIDEDNEKQIWSGISGGHQIRWTTKDIYLDEKPLYSSYTKKYFKESTFSEVYDSRDKNNKAIHSVSMSGRIVSLVGNYLTIETEVYHWGGIIQYYSHVTVFDLNNPFNPKSKKSISQLTAKLTDIFTDAQIKNAFASNKHLNEIFSDMKIDLKKIPKKNFINNLTKMYENEDKYLNFAKQGTDEPGYITNKTLVGFVFNDLNDNVAKVLLELAPLGKTHNVPYIELEFETPNELLNDIIKTKNKENGFLYLDNDIVFKQGDGTSFDFDKSGNIEK